MEGMSQYLNLFKEEAAEVLQALNAALLALEDSPDDKQKIEELFRAAHSLKGMAATMGFDEIANLTHKMENLMDKVRKGTLEVNTSLIDVLLKASDVLQVLLEQIDSGEPKSEINLDSLITELEKASRGDSTAPKVEEKKKQVNKQENTVDNGQASLPRSSQLQTVRVKLEHLDNLMNLVGELVISKARLDQLENKSSAPELSDTLDRIKVILGDLQHEVMQVRMVPAGQVFNRYPRVVRDIAHELGKEVKFVIEGSEIELDRAILDEIGEPLVHILRNAIGHGIESPEERELKGKPRLGTVHLIARREKDGAVVEVADDGGGIDTASIREIAVRNGFISRQEAETLDESEIVRLICLPGFTSASETTSLSGRGVGVDAVKAKIESLGGSLTVESELDKGTHFIMKLPSSLAIIKALLVKVGSDTYAIPLKNIAEVVEVEKDELKTVKDEEVIVIHDQVVPLIYLRDFFGLSRNGESQKGALPMVVVEIGERQKGLVVDTILFQQDVVVKPLTEVLQSMKGLGGATILGNGKVAFILDVRSLSAMIRRKKEC